MSGKQPVSLFYSYSHQDEELRDQLDTHLKLLQRQGIIDSWHDRKIEVGSEWSKEIDENLENANIILLLVSASFLASDYCFDVEVRRAMERHNQGSAVVIPISLRQCDTTAIDFMKLQGLPKNFKPVVHWHSPDEAFTDISKGIRAVAERIRQSNQKLDLLKPQSNNNAPAIFNVPVNRNPFFTGRDKTLTDLYDQLHSKNELVVKPAQNAKALSGLGGVGKTQLVAEYSHRYQKEYSAVLWVLSDGKELLYSNFASLAFLLGFKLEGQAEQILAVQSWLSDNTGWLLIFDNAETLELLNTAHDLLPNNINGHVLFTTRAQATGHLAAVSVDCFDDETGALFLLRRSKTVVTELPTLEFVRSQTSDEDWHAAISLVQELGGLALAIDQAGAYIEQTGCGLAGYLKRYRTDAPLLLDKRGYVQRADHPQAAYKTFLLAMEKAKRRSNLAYEILLDSALLHPDGISEKLYFDVEPLLLDGALEVLKDYSLIQRDAGKSLFTVHRLIQVVIRDVCDG